MSLPYYSRAGATGSRRHGYRVCDIHVSVTGPCTRKEKVQHAFKGANLEGVKYKADEHKDCSEIAVLLQE